MLTGDTKGNFLAFDVKNELTTEGSIGSENWSANVVSVEHHREGMTLPIGQTEVELTLGLRDGDHCADVLDALAGHGYAVERLQ